MTDYPFVWRNKQYTFQFRWRFLLLCLFFVCLFSGLGMWQLHRYHFKAELLRDYATRATQAPAPFSASTGQEFQHVTVQGTYVNEQTMMVQNRVYRQQQGFEILTPLQLAGDKKLLLVDRGWVKSVDEGQDVLTGEQQVTGLIKYLNEYQFILGKNIMAPDKRPLIIQKINIKDISRVTHAAYYPFVLRLDPAAANGFVRDWTISAVDPRRHLGYAMQWFLMAIVLVVAYLSFSISRAGNAEFR
jgi:surfeit locus 1 family protein